MLALDKTQKQHTHSKSGPQTPISTLTKRRDHETRCVFNRLLRDDSANLDYTCSPSDADPRKVYVAVQQGQDIPLKGLRKPAPQPNSFKGKETIASC